MTKTLTSKLLWLVALAVPCGACSSDGAVDIGHDVAKLADYAASWDGYAEAAGFPKSGSGRVRLRLDPSGQGTLEVGSAPPLPVATQAEGGYLLDDTGAGGSPASEAFRDGFQYPVHEAQVEAGRIRFGIDPLDLYGTWCTFVTPFKNTTAVSGYGCGSDGGGRNFGNNPNDPGVCEFQIPGADPLHPDTVNVDCGVYELCIGVGVCTCTATACGPHTIPSDGTSLDSYPIVVDAAIDPTGDSLTGTLAIKDGDKTDRITIRLVK